ncbi:MAG: DnaJ domain-containing protein, partial [Myxococcota bacterium]|nr:DnaJ domain-containing protein [Myxococcota bacterium]
MNPRDLDHIQRFLTTVGRSSLFEYFGVEPDAPDDGVEAAIKQRRAWAQGQQSNPKYRQEAIWVIKNIARCRRAMVDGRLQYIAATRTAAQQKEFEVLDLFILGNIADGVLSVRGERAILEQGDAQGLPRDLVQSRLAELLVERGARREGDVASGPFVDHYAILGAHPDADINSLERAYRERYHAARQLADPRETERVYAELDAAWEVLRSPGTRARYDERHREEREDDPADLTPAASVGR